MANPGTHVYFQHMQTSQANVYEQDFNEERRDRERAHSMLENARAQIRGLEERLHNLQHRPGNQVYSHQEMAAVQAERDAALQQVETNRMRAGDLLRELEQERRKVSRV